MQDQIKRDSASSLNNHSSRALSTLAISSKPENTPENRGSQVNRPWNGSPAYSRGAWIRDTRSWPRRYKCESNNTSAVFSFSSALDPLSGLIPYRRSLFPKHSRKPLLPGNLLG